MYSSCRSRSLHQGTESHESERGRYPRGQRGGRGGDFGRSEHSRGGQSSRGGFRGRDDRGGRGSGRGDSQRQPIMDAPPGSIKLVSNQFTITKPRDSFMVYKHLVDIEDGRDETREPRNEEKREIVAAFLRSANVPNADLLPYDGNQILIATSELTFPRTIFKFKKLPYNVEITYTGTRIDLATSMEHVRAQNEAAPIIDIIMNWAAQYSADRLRRHSFIPRDPKPTDIKSLHGVPGGCLVVGHSQTVQSFSKCQITIPTEFGRLENPFQKAEEYYMSLIVNPACGPFLERQPLNEYVKNAFGINLLGKSIPSTAAKTLSKLKRFKVETNYIRDPVTGEPSKRTFKIEGISLLKTAADHEFEYEGRSITLKNYFATRYGITLRFPTAPLLQLMPKTKETYLPIELVQLSFQKLPGLYGERVKTSMAESMIMAPADRQQFIMRKREIFTDNPVLTHFQLNVSTSFTACNAIVLAAPSVKYRNTTDTPRRGAWNLMGKKFLKPASVDDYLVISCSRSHDREVSTFVRELSATARSLGMEGRMENRVECVGFRDLATVKSNLLSAKRYPKYILVVLPQYNIADYSHVKNTFAGTFTTACVIGGSTPYLNPNKRGSPGHSGNILSKINKKLGGINHTLGASARTSTTLTTLMGSDQSFMILAVAIVQPMVANVKQYRALPAVCTVLGSSGSEAQIYKHSVSVQERGNPLAQDLSDLVSDVIIKGYGNNAQKWPKRIVVFREGLTESQMLDVCSVEARAVEECYRRADARLPAITFIVVQRAHAVRFFNNPQSPAASSNIPPGTAVFESSVQPGPYANFFLVPHAGLKGTSRCPRYFILRNDLSVKSKLPLKFWVCFCHEQCYSYEVCQRAVSYPAPLYYATKLAQRVSLHTKPLMDRLMGFSLDLDAASSACGTGETPKYSDEQLSKVFKEINAALKKISKTSPDMFYI